MRALQGLRVLEFAGLAPGPMAGLILRDYGADVIRVDRTGKTEFETDWLSRGKRSIAVNLKNSAGHDVVKKLACKADVLLDPYRPGVLEKAGLGPGDVMRGNPKLVYARITGYGQDGPLAMRAGHDLNYLAHCGLLDVLGRRDQPPTPPGNLLADFAGGSFTAVMGIMMALYQRERTGKGMVVDVAMSEGAAYVGSFVHAARGAGIWSGPRGTNLLDSGSPVYDTYRTKDGKYMAVAALEENFFSNLIRGLGLAPEDVPSHMDPRQWPALRQSLTACFATKTRDEWAEIFNDLDACVTPVQTLDEYACHPHTVARHAVRTTNTRRGPGVYPAPAPVLDGDREARGRSQDARVGEHTADVLAELGHSEDEAARLVAEGAVALATTQPL